MECARKVCVKRSCQFQLINEYFLHGQYSNNNNKVM